MSTTISTRGRCAGSAPLRHARLTFGRGSLCLRFLCGRLDLFGLFQAEQELILRQRLGSSAEAVALQFLDDLAQPGVLDLARQHHRLQRVRVVGKLVCGHRHGPNQTTSAGGPRQRNQG